MPKYSLHCVESFMDSCYYNDVEADSLEEAVLMAASGDLPIDQRKNSEFDHWDYLAEAEEDDETVSEERIREVTDHVERELAKAKLKHVTVTASEPAAMPTFTARELATVLAALRLWQRTEVTDADLLAIASEGRDDLLCGLAVEEIDVLCARLNA